MSHPRTGWHSQNQSPAYIPCLYKQPTKITTVVIIISIFGHSAWDFPATSSQNVSIISLSWNCILNMDFPFHHRWRRTNQPVCEHTLHFLCKRRTYSIQHQKQSYDSLFKEFPDMMGYCYNLPFTFLAVIIFNFDQLDLPGPAKILEVADLFSLAVGYRPLINVYIVDRVLYSTSNDRLRNTLVIRELTSDPSYSVCGVTVEISSALPVFRGLQCSLCSPSFFKFDPAHMLRKILHKLAPFHSHYLKSGLDVPWYTDSKKDTGQAKTSWITSIIYQTIYFSLFHLSQSKLSHHL